MQEIKKKKSIFLTWVLKVISDDGSSRIRHLIPMQRNFIMKLVMPTAHNTAQKPSGSIFGLRKIKLREKFLLLNSSLILSALPIEAI